MILPLVKIAEDPDAADDEPDKQENPEEALKAPGAAIESWLDLPIICLFLLLLLLTECPFEDAGDGMHKTHGAEDDKKDGNVLLEFTVIQVDGTWSGGGVHSQRARYQILKSGLNPMDSRCRKPYSMYYKPMM